MVGLGVIGGSDCEALRDGLLAQPTNALTSAAYVVAGIVVWIRIPPQRRIGAGGVYAVLLGLVGIGSILYHGPQPPGSKFLHDAPIPMLLLLIAAVAGHRLLHRRSVASRCDPGAPAHVGRNRGSRRLGVRVRSNRLALVRPGQLVAAARRVAHRHRSRLRRRRRHALPTRSAVTSRGVMGATRGHEHPCLMLPGGCLAGARDCFEVLWKSISARGTGPASWRRLPQPSGGGWRSMTSSAA